MKKLNYTLLLFLFAFALISCENDQEDIQISTNDFHDAMQEVTDVIVHDIFSPPVASRIYAYSSIAAYEVLAQQDSNYVSLAGQLDGLAPMPKPEASINTDVAAVESLLLVGRALIFSEDKIDVYRETWHQSLLEQGMSESKLNASLNFGKVAADHILKWADGDNYKQTRTFEKFTVKEGDSSRWQPTPPAYIEAIEPHWNKIRPFVIDSADQFIPNKPTPFDMDENSQFFQEVKEVYEVGNSLTEEQAEIASFWDCNPYVMNVHGHVMFATKKITPGGHWIGIAKIACQVSGADMMKTASAYALTSIALADGFISCWDEKYRSNLIRPETVINKYIDEEWLPLLQTPPFPEYTSGHSVISGAAGVALTSIFGEPFHFVDSTEVKYGLNMREFDSFTEASSEAAISRLYGGIHYRPAIEVGVVQGRELGKFVVNNITLQRDEKISSR